MSVRVKDILIGSVSGNSGTTTKLATPRAINGTNFDGSAAITTSHWGSGRTISLTGSVTGSASVNGSGNVSINTEGKYLVHQDTRSDNQAPYASGFLKGLSVHLKSNSTDSLDDGGTYHTLVQVYPWNDNSGGPGHQIALTTNGRIWIRSGSSSWDSWKKIMFTTDTASVASKLGTATVGSTTKPIYLNAGTATALSSTIGSASKPVYLSSGAITACSSTVGAANKPIYSNAGTLTACSSTVGSSSVPVYMNAGTLTAISSLSIGNVTCTNQLISGRFINKANEGVRSSRIPFELLACRTGYSVYKDNEFSTGNNSVEVYNNNSSNSPNAVKIERISDSSSGNASGKILKITHVGGATPNYGGFVQTISSRANAVFVQIFRAKIPSGYTLNTASNSMGTSYQDQWITTNTGTGKWAWYGRIVYCGETGSFSSGGHVSLSGGTAPTSSAPLVWYMASCELYDLTKTSSYPEQLNGIGTALTSLEAAVK